MERPSTYYMILTINDQLRREKLRENLLIHSFSFFQRAGCMVLAYNFIDGHHDCSTRFTSATDILIFIIFHQSIKIN